VETDLCREIGSGVVGGEVSRRGVGCVLSLGLTRRVRVSEEYPFRHQKIRPLAAPGCYPDPAQQRIRLCAGPPPCAAMAQATWYNNGHRKARSSDNMNRSEKRSTIAMEKMRWMWGLKRTKNTSVDQTPVTMIVGGNRGD
jgi:hypothetical protein